jgi:hypothetical protein
MTRKLGEVVDNLNNSIEKRRQVGKLIGETSSAYLSIVESSSALLDVLKASGELE